MTSQVRLLQGQTVLQDDWKLAEYNIQDGATISALFEPDVDINIEVSTGQHTQQHVVSNSTSVMALKLLVSDATGCGIVPDKMQLMFEEEKLRR